VAIVLRFVARSTVLATLLLLGLLGLELRSAVLLNTWLPPIISALIVGYLLYFVHMQANSNRSLQVKLGTWDTEVRHRLINELTVILGSLELMDSSERHRLAALVAAKNMRNSLISENHDNHGAR
jgi:hypothetical protein